MDTNNILLILGLILLLFFIMRNINVNTSTPNVSKTTVVYRRPPVVAPHYNSYKTQYYN